MKKEAPPLREAREGKNKSATSPAPLKHLPGLSVKLPPRPARERKGSHAPMAVYDGRERLATIQEHGDSWRLLDRRGEPLGTYPTRQAALDAVADSLLRGAA